MITDQLVEQTISEGRKEGKLNMGLKWDNPQVQIISFKILPKDKEFIKQD